MVDTQRRDKHQSTAHILSHLADGDAADQLDLRSVFTVFGRRAFAVLFLLAGILAMNPLPGMAGGLSGPLVMFAGLQLIFGRRRPWLPAFLQRKTIRRSFFIRVRDRFLPRLRKLEHLIRPRLISLFDTYFWNAISGLLLTVFGLLVLLPIPFTNFAFGVLLLAYAVAYIERDGAMLLICWLITIAVIVVFGVLSGALVEAVSSWLEQILRLQT